MRSYALVALMAGAAMASPLPQAIDWDAVEDVVPVPQPTIPVVNAAAAQTTIAFSSAAAAASVLSAVLADPTDSTLKMVKRIDSSTCGANSAPWGDSDTAFSQNPAYPAAANSAPTPFGYRQVFQNLTASVQAAYGYLGYSVLSTYDTNVCASKCNGIAGCTSFNLYFERDPAVDPTTTCSNPASKTVIKCVFYGSAIYAAEATNYGQYRMDFHVVIAGSNGYVSTFTPSPPSGYSPVTYLDNAAINAPLDCNGKDTYLTVKIFNNGQPFDIGLCSAACTAVSDDNRAHPAADGTYKTCQFFNTYILYQNSAAVGQYCALYTESWPASFATNKGQYRGTDHYTIGNSYTSSNSTGGADKPVGCTNPTSPS